MCDLFCWQSSNLNTQEAEAGARSMRQAIDAAMAGVPVVEYAKDHPELARMLGHLHPDLKKNFDLMN